VYGGFPGYFCAEDYMKGSFRSMRGEGDDDIVPRSGLDVERRFAEKRWHATQVLEWGAA
jgi:hypothetical protein